MKKLVNGILIDLTTQEITQREQDIIQSQSEQQIIEIKKEQNIINKQSALTKLSALGLTEAEIKAIIG